MANQGNGSSTHEICKSEEEKDPYTLPAGFRFLPSDEVIITKYLRPKALGNDIPCKDIVVDVNVNNYSPAQLAGSSVCSDQYINNNKMSREDHVFPCGISGLKKALLCPVDNRVYGTDHLD